MTVLENMLSGLLVAILVPTAIAPDPIFEAISCHTNKKVDLQVRFANNKWVKIGGCRNLQLVNTNARTWLPMNCIVDWNTPFVATITADDKTYVDGEPQRNFMCVAKEGVVEDVTFYVTGPTVTPGNVITGIVEPGVLMRLTQSDGTTPVNAAHLGDSLCMFLYLDDDFKDDYSIQVNTIVMESGGETVYLTGGPGTGVGCQNADEWGEVFKLSETEMKVCFTVFSVLPPTQTATTQLYVATVNVCFAAEFLDCYISGCIAPTTPIARRKRDVSNKTSEEIEVSLSLTILSDDDGNSDAGVGQSGSTGAQEQERDSTQTCEVCMKKSVLYGLIAFFIPALLLAFGASICLYMRSRKSHKTVDEIDIITRGSSGSLRSSFRSNPSFRTS